MIIWIVVYLIIGSLVIWWALCSHNRHNWNILIWLADGAQHNLIRDIYAWQGHIDNGITELTKPGPSTQKVHLRAEGWLWMMVMITLLMFTWPLTALVVLARRMRTT